MQEKHRHSLVQQQEEPPSPGAGENRAGQTPARPHAWRPNPVSRAGAGDSEPPSHARVSQVARTQRGAPQRRARRDTGRARRPRPGVGAGGHGGPRYRCQQCCAPSAAPQRPGKAGWVNKYSKDAPGHVFFMSSFRYQKLHPLRRSNASVTEVIFAMNDLFEKLVLIISVMERQLGSLRGGGRRDAAGTRGSQGCRGAQRGTAPRCSPFRGKRVPCEQGTPRKCHGWLFPRPPSYLETQAVSGGKGKARVSCKLGGSVGNGASPSGRPAPCCRCWHRQQQL